eukprot:352544-Chlamydomonas_euryale.AAC.28
MRVCACARACIRACVAIAACGQAGRSLSAPGAMPSTRRQFCCPQDANFAVHARLAPPWSHACRAWGHAAHCIACQVPWCAVSQLRRPAAARAMRPRPEHARLPPSCAWDLRNNSPFLRLAP